MVTLVSHILGSMFDVKCFLLATSLFYTSPIIAHTRRIAHAMIASDPTTVFFIRPGPFTVRRGAMEQVNAPIIPIAVMLNKKSISRAVFATTTAMIGIAISMPVRMVDVSCCLCACSNIELIAGNME